MTAGNGNEGEVNWGAGERETAIEDQAGGQSRTVQQSIRVPALEEHGVTTSDSRLHLFRKFARRSEYRGEYALGGEIRRLPEPPFRPPVAPEQHFMGVIGCSHAFLPSRINAALP